MEEKTFYIRDVTGQEKTFPTAWEISESELRRRLIHIAHIIHPGFAPPFPGEEPDIIDYLLHGEKKDEWEEWAEKVETAITSGHNIKAIFMKMPRK